MLRSNNQIISCDAILYHVLLGREGGLSAVSAFVPVNMVKSEIMCGQSVQFQSTSDYWTAEHTVKVAFFLSNRGRLTFVHTMQKYASVTSYLLQSLYLWNCVV